MVYSAAIPCGRLPSAATAYHDRMTDDTKETRRARFAELLKIRSVDQLCQALDVTPARISHMKTGFKGIGGDYARKIESALGLPRYWLDGDAHAVKEPRQAYHGIYLTRAGALLAAEWEKLDVIDRAEIEADIHTRVAKKKRKRAERGADAETMKGN